MLNIPFEKLRFFYHAAKFNNFSKAGKQLFVTEGAVSQQIKDLEWKLGKKLFLRRGPKLKLTPEGELLFTLIGPVIDQVDNLIEDFTNLTESLPGSLKIAATQSILLNLLPPVIQEFEIGHPGVNLVVFNLPSLEINEIVLSGGVDLGISPLMNTVDGLTRKELIRFPWTLITPLEHPLSRCKTITIKKIASFPVIMPTGDASHYTVLQTLAKTHGLELNVTMKTARWEVVKKYVEIGLGIAVIPQICLSNSDNDKLYSRRLDDLLGHLHVGLVTNKKKNLTPATEEFSEILIRSCLNNNNA